MTQLYLTAADTSRVQAGERSIQEKLGDAMTAGVAGTLVSGWAGIYNTGVAVARVFDPTVEEMNVAATLAQQDQSWADYYKENQGVIDTAGFIAGSILPGGAAVKALNVARSGKNVGMAGRVLGFTQNQQAKYAARALEEVAQEGGNIFGRFNRSKAASMAWGTADNILQTAVFETAAAMTMKQSPLLADESWSDVSWDIVKSSLAGGALGGLVEGLWLNKAYKDAGKAVAQAERKYDSIATTPGADFGDQVFELVDTVMRLPKEVLEADRSVPFEFKIGGKDVLEGTGLNVGPMLDRRLKKTTEDILVELRSKLTNVVASDTSVGGPLSRMIVETVQDGLAEKADLFRIQQRLGDFFFGLKKIESIGGSPADFRNEIRFLNPKASLKSDAAPLSLFSATRQAAEDVGYRVIGDLSAAKFGTKGIDFQNEAQTIAKAFDAWIDPTTGSIKVNPASAIFRQVNPEDEQLLKRVFNLHTRTASTTSVPTAADIATANKPLQVMGTGVSVGDRIFGFKTHRFDVPKDQIEATARHAWAAEAAPLITGTNIQYNDISMLDRVVQQESLRLDKTVVQVQQADGTFVRLTSRDQAQEFARTAKYEEVLRLLGYQRGADDLIGKAGKPIETDLRAVAYRANVEESWVGRLIANDFDLAATGTKGMARRLTDYLNRENLVFSYGRKELSEAASFESPMLAYHYRLQDAERRARNSFHAVLGEDSARWSSVESAQLLGQADATGAGASFWGFAQADFLDRLRMTMQHSGTAVANTTRDRVDRVISALTPEAMALRANPKVGAELGAIVTMIRRQDKLLHLENLGNNQWQIVDLATVKKIREGRTVPYEFQKAIPREIGEFLAAHQAQHARQVEQLDVLAAAHGVQRNFDPEALYIPPIDTKKIPFFALVRWADGMPGGTSEVAMITARTAEELATKVAEVRGMDKFQVIEKSGSEAWHKALGDFEYARALNSPVIDPTLRKSGRLGDFLPNLDVEGALGEFFDYHKRVESKIVRDAVSVRYGQLFTELKRHSDSFTAISTSKWEFQAKLFDRVIADPFADLMKLGLNVPKRTNFPFWHEMNEFVDALGTKAYRAVERTLLDMKTNRVNHEQANKILSKYGLPEVFNSEQMFLDAQHGPERSLVRLAVGKANMAIATLALRMDFINAAINAVTTPILLGPQLGVLRRAVQNHPELKAKFDDLMTVKVPGQDLSIPTVWKVMHQAVGDYVGPNKDALANRFTELGAVSPAVTQFYAMMDDLALASVQTPGRFSQATDKLVDFAEKWTGNARSEDFTRFVSAAAAKRMTDPLVEAGRMSVKEQDSWILQLVNQAQGNYVTSQRPIVFQGVIGAAIGLFQTFAFNMYQQMFKHIGDRNYRQLAVLGAMQTGMFGMNGLPMFEAINTHLIGNANINEGHHTVYSAINQAVGKEVGDWMMYGTLSAFPAFTDQWMALYSRGDLNPRHLTIVPTNPMNVPAVEASTRVIGTLLNMGRGMLNGSDVTKELLYGLEHNGINRPLAGLAKVLQGYSTTGSGALISANDDLLSITTFGRLLGAKPMDEAVGLNAKFRSVAFEARDRERIQALGRSIKQKLVGGGVLSEEDILEFGQRYVQVGGRAESYSRALQEWAKQSNESILNTARKAHKTEEGQRLLEIMGADPIQDYVWTKQEEVPE